MFINWPSGVYYWVPTQHKAQEEDDKSIAEILARLCDIINNTEKRREKIMKHEQDEAYRDRLIRDLKALAYDEFEQLIMDLMVED